MRVLVECLPDETLVRGLGCVRKEVTHFSGRSRVIRYLEKSRGLVGMIDEDPGSEVPSYFHRLELVSDQHGIRELRDGTRGHRIIVLKPQLEGWLIATAKTAGVELWGFAAVDRPSDLHREINSKLESVKRLVRALEEAKSPRVAHLRSLLQSR